MNLTHWFGFHAAAHVGPQERVLDHEPAGALQHHGTVVRRQDVVDERRREVAERHRRLVHVDAAPAWGIASMA